MRVPFDAMNGHGQSLEPTIDKQRGLASALSIGTKIYALKCSNRGYHYWHLDTNAGSGHNDLADVPGSPIVFHTIADANNLPINERCAFFCDINRAGLDHLVSRLGSSWRSSSYLFCGDNEEVLDVFASSIKQSGESPRYAVGSIIVDPNGYWYRNKAGIGAPVNALPRFARMFPCIDIILNLNMSAYWKQRSQGQDVLPPRDVLTLFHKKCWLVRRTFVGNGRWLLAVGRNIETGDHRKIGFHKLDSLQGHDVMVRVEGKRQDELPI